MLRVLGESYGSGRFVIGEVTLYMVPLERRYSAAWRGSLALEQLLLLDRHRLFAFCRSSSGFGVFQARTFGGSVFQAQVLMCLGFRLRF